MVDRWTEAKELAMAAFRDLGPAHVNCAEAVVKFSVHAFQDDPDAVTVARYMGGGSVGMGATCGAIEGAVTALGLRDYFSPADHAGIDAGEKAALQALIRDFEEEFGAVTCRGLTGFDISTPEGYALFRADPVSQRCDDFVSWVCDRLGSMLR
ncbi:MAG: C-GCAxxG-C-C family protein [Thermoleophilia bacterium]